MILNDTLDEAVGTNSLFHALSIGHLCRALEQGYFELGVPNQSDRETQQGYPYYLSLARSANAEYNKGSSTQIEFDRDYLSSRFRITPIDYWASPNQPFHHRSEQEDRLLSKKPTLEIPSEGSKLIKRIMIHVRNEQDQRWERKLILLCNRLGIPVKLYKTGRRVGLPNADVPIGQVKDRLMRAQPKTRLFSEHKRDLAVYRELLHKTSYASLSPEAKGVIDKMLRYPNETSRVVNAFHSARSFARPELIKTMELLRRSGLNTPEEYFAAMLEKWENLKRLNEKFIDLDSWDGGKFPVLVNPLGPEVVAFMKRNSQAGELRGLIDQEGNVYLWYAVLAVHFNGRSRLIDAGLLDHKQNAFMWLYLSLTKETDAEFSWEEYMKPYGPIWIAGSGGKQGQRGFSVRGRGPHMDRLIRSLQRIPTAEPITEIAVDDSLTESFGGYSKGAWWVDPQGEVHDVPMVGDDYDHVAYLEPNYKEQVEQEIRQQHPNMDEEDMDEIVFEAIQEYRSDLKLQYIMDGWVRSEVDDMGGLQLEAMDYKLARRAAQILLTDQARYIDFDVPGHSYRIEPGEFTKFLKGGWRPAVNEGIERYGNIKVFVNPTMDQVRGLLKTKQLRGTYDTKTKTTYVWNAYDGVHWELEDHIGVPYNESTFVIVNQAVDPDPDIAENWEGFEETIIPGIEVAFNKFAKNCPLIKRLLGRLTESEVLEIFHGKSIVAYRYEYKIAVDQPGNATYVSVWNDKNQQVGFLRTRGVTEHGGKEYIIMGAVDLIKTAKGKGIGTQMYRALLRNLAPKLAGMVSYLPDVVNKKQVPKIHKRLGGPVPKGTDYHYLPRIDESVDALPKPVMIHKPITEGSHDRLMEQSGPPFMYHGTSAERWTDPHEGDTVLWLAEDPAQAEQYARDLIRDGGTPILVKFSLPDLQRAGLDLALKDPTRNHRTMVARGNVEAVKHLGSITPMQV